MAKRIIICLDGTSNQPVGNRTNVVRLYRMLEQIPGQQMAYYQPGVGTIRPNDYMSRMRQRWWRVMDSATAVMLNRHVSSAYRYLMTHYQDGSEICLFGFSRGAYSARVLAGMLSKVGLLHRGHEEMIRFAWDVYRTPRNYHQAGRFRKTFSRQVKVHFLGLWDTVSSVGMPWQPQVYPYTFNNPQVKTVRHALSLDEHRAMFASNLWRDKIRPPQDVQQVWFPGVHADVGGGYNDDESQLAMIPLSWMVREARAAGLEFNDLEVANLLIPKGRGGKIPPPDVAAISQQYAHGQAHDELDKLAWKAVEWIPLPRRRPNDKGEYKRRWRWHRGRYRTVPDQAFVHESVRMRQQHMPGYAEGRIPDTVQWVM